MANNNFQIKKSSVPGRVPKGEDILVGQLAVNLADAILYTKRANGEVISVGSGTAGAKGEKGNVGSKGEIGEKGEVGFGDKGQKGEPGSGGGGGNVDLTAVSTNILPISDGTYSLGNSTYRFSSLYLTSNTLYIGNTALGESANGNITINEIEIISANGQFLGPGGTKGEKGDTGSKGDKGDGGAAGAKGQKGEVGVSGATGPSGSTGDKGDKGEIGTSGSNGAKGDKGTAGSTGDKGDTGQKGATGAKGETGDKGDTGSNGSKGEVGDKGSTGSEGNKGDKGDTGSIGLTGAKGEKGSIGDKGEKGFGDKGISGEKGEKGSQGLISRYTYVNSYHSISLYEPVLADSSSGGFTLVLPSTPLSGDWVRIADGNNWSNNNVTLDRNGHTIEGQSQNLILDTGNITLELIYSSNTWLVFIE